VSHVEASAVATELLTGVETRLAHSRAVARQSAVVSSVLDSSWSSALREAAWLHDVGYAPSIAATGFHPLDGARWLRANGWRPDVCNLVAWHTRAGTEAELRKLITSMAREFPPPPTLAQSALAWADLTSSPTGECCTVGDRLEDILRRYSPDSVVHQATNANLLDLLGDVHRIETRIDALQGELR
jgi:hypothetical protein